MKLLLTIHESDVRPGAEDLDSSDFSHRQAARAIVTNEFGQVALLKVNKHHYHKLPGGGVEAGEDMRQALARELLEEIGCEAKVTSEVGEIIEFRDRWKTKQTSHCYLAQQHRQQRSPMFTEEELNDGFEVVWVADLDKAILLLQQDEPADYMGRFVQRRDLTFLKVAASLMLE